MSGQGPYPGGTYDVYAASPLYTFWMICWRLIAKLTAWRTRLSAHGSFLPGLSVICSSRKAAFRPLSTWRFPTPRSERATSTDSVAPSMAPARRAATRACSSVITFMLIPFMYG